MGYELEFMVERLGDLRLELAEESGCAWSDSHTPEEAEARAAKLRQLHDEQGQLLEKLIQQMVDEANNGN